jgi:hypothetical protein
MLNSQNFHIMKPAIFWIQSEIINFQRKEYLRNFEKLENLNSHFKFVYRKKGLFWTLLSKKLFLIN